MRSTQSPKKFTATLVTSMSELDFTSHIRRPFEVDAVQITTENIHEAAALIGTHETTPQGHQYIIVDRNLVPNIVRVYPGYYMTRMGNNVRCYSKRIFEDQFIKLNDRVAEGWAILVEESEKQNNEVS